MAINVPAMRAGGHEHTDVQVSVGSQPNRAGSPPHLARRFPCDPSSVGAARRAVEESCAWLQPTLLADLRLLVSELVSNSVEHAAGRGTTIGLEVSISDERVRAEVHDGGRGFIPRASRPQPGTPSGRGLYLVDQLAAGWGVSGTDGTRVWRVWFELDRERLEATDDDPEPSAEASAREGKRVNGHKGLSLSG